MMRLKIAIGNDHAGYEYKTAIIGYLESKGFEVEDLGSPSSDSVDYPDFVHPVSQRVNNGDVRFGVLICGSGNGVAMTANKYPNVRCGLAWNPEVAALVRQHNDANAIAIPARFVDLEVAKDILEAFLRADFEGGRHQRRVNKINQTIT